MPSSTDLSIAVKARIAMEQRPRFVPSRNVIHFQPGFFHFNGFIDIGLIEISVIPILLSQGVPLLPAGKRSPRLRLDESKAMPSGIVALNYSVDYDARKVLSR